MICFTSINRRKIGIEEAGHFDLFSYLLGLPAQPPQSHSKTASEKWLTAVLKCSDGLQVRRSSEAVMALNISFFPCVGVAGRSSNEHYKKDEQSIFI